MTIAVVTAGQSTPSATRLLGDRLAEGTVSALAELGVPAEPVFIELRELAADLANQALTRFAGQRLQQALDSIGRADGVIAISPIYNGSFTGLFKLFFDALDEGVLAGRPVLLAATGGTPRHSLAVDHALLPLFYYLKAIIAPHPVFAATKDWGAAGGKLEKRISRAAGAFAPLVAGARPSRPDDQLEVIDFTELLDG
ncbi:MAG: NAD(P)H-dependent oxidoreductase [Propionicimonas sp.]